MARINIFCKSLANNRQHKQLDYSSANLPQLLPAVTAADIEPGCNRIKLRQKIAIKQAKACKIYKSNPLFRPAMNDYLKQFHSHFITRQNNVADTPE